MHSAGYIAVSFRLKVTECILESFYDYVIFDNERKKIDTVSTVLKSRKQWESAISKTA